MSGSGWFLVTGSVLEVVGFAVGAVAVSETRRAFTADPPALSRAWDAFVGDMKELVRLLSGRPRPPIEVIAGSAAMSVSRLQTQVRVSIGPWGSASTEERLELLKTRVEQHDEAIDNLTAELKTEVQARIAAAAIEEREREDLRVALDARISQAAASGLGKESFALFCFVLGVILSLMGALSS